MLKPKKITIVISDELKGITKEYKKINFINQKHVYESGCNSVAMIEALFSN